MWKTQYRQTFDCIIKTLLKFFPICSYFCCYVSVMILDARQKRAEELRRLTDKSASMSEEQLTELRADIKVPAQHSCSTLMLSFSISEFDLVFYFITDWMGNWCLFLFNLQLKADSPTYAYKSRNEKDKFWDIMWVGFFSLLLFIYVFICSTLWASVNMMRTLEKL